MTRRRYDLSSPQFTADPYSIYAEMRQHDPVYRHTGESADMPGGPQTVYSTGVSWYVTRHRDALEILKDFKRFVHDFRLALTEEQLATIPPAPPLMGALAANLTALEPPVHTKLRGLVSQAFTRKQVQDMAGQIQEITADLVAGFKSRGGIEFMDEFAYLLPIRVITGMLGLPFEDAPLLRRWAEIKPPATQEEAAVVMAGLTEAKEYVDHQIAIRRDDPRDDLITSLMSAEIEGEKLEEIQLFSMIMMLIVAGFETTANLIGNGMLALLDHPEQLEKLRADPSLAENAVEEMLRFDSSIEHALFRWVAEDCTFRSQELRRGDRIVVVQASANRDAVKFPDPDRFDITRDDLRHLAFGHGIHYCLGAPLARLESSIAFPHLLASLPRLRLGVPRDEIRYRGGFLPFRGLETLPLEWDA